MEESVKFVIILGNVVDGISIVGPFETMHDALDKAKLISDTEWVIGEITHPDDF